MLVHPAVATAFPLETLVPPRRRDDCDCRDAQWAGRRPVALHGADRPGHVFQSSVMRGSSASRKPSPMKFTASTVTLIMKPGGIQSQTYFSMISMDCA